MKALLPDRYHYYIYIFALALLLVGMPLSKFLMSLSQIILACNWVLEGHLKQKFRSYFHNRAALILSSVLILHLIGLIYTTDFEYAFRDIRIKLPLIFLPLLLSTSKPVETKIFDFLLKLFIAAVFSGSIVSMLVLNGLIHKEVVDIRNASIFISHIRFALLISLAIFFSGYLLKKAEGYVWKFTWFACICWLLIFLVIMEYITGLTVTLFTGMVLFIYQISRAKGTSRIALTGVLAGLFLAGFLYVKAIADDSKTVAKLDPKLIETFTAKGNLYQHDLKSDLSENGHLIWINYNLKEMEAAWNGRSSLDFNGKDLKGNELRFTLMRFLASKGGNKDAAAVEQLTDPEVHAIERGVVNINYRDVSSLKGRIHEIFWELNLYNSTGDPSGHSITQRFEFWKTGCKIFRDHPVAGVGTGDVKLAYDAKYEEIKSPLGKEWRLHSHNQFLSIAVAFGIIGLIWFLISLIYPLVREKRLKDYLYITFFIICVLSFFTEDTLETQAGVTFYAFFNSFLLFVNPNRKFVE